MIAIAFSILLAGQVASPVLDAATQAVALAQEATVVQAKNQALDKGLEAKNKNMAKNTDQAKPNRLATTSKTQASSDKAATAGSMVGLAALLREMAKESGKAHQDKPVSP